MVGKKTKTKPKTAKKKKLTKAQKKRLAKIKKLKLLLKLKEKKIKELKKEGGKFKTTNINKNTNQIEITVNNDFKKKATRRQKKRINKEDKLEKKISTGGAGVLRQLEIESNRNTRDMLLNQNKQNQLLLDNRVKELNDLKSKMLENPTDFKEEIKRIENTQQALIERLNFTIEERDRLANDRDQLLVMMGGGKQLLTRQEQELIQVSKEKLLEEEKRAKAEAKIAQEIQKGAELLKIEQQKAQDILKKQKEEAKIQRLKEIEEKEKAKLEAKKLKEEEIKRVLEEKEKEMEGLIAKEERKLRKIETEELEKTFKILREDATNEAKKKVKLSNIVSVVRDNIKDPEKVKESEKQNLLLRNPSSFNKLLKGGFIVKATGGKNNFKLSDFSGKGKQRIIDAIIILIADEEVQERSKKLLKDIEPTTVIAKTRKVPPKEAKVLKMAKPKGKQKTKTKKK